MAIKLVRKNADEYFINYEGTSVEDYLDFTELLSSVPSRYMDEETGSWVMDRVSARKIQDELDVPDVGGGMKLTPYNYQKQAISACLAQPGSLILLPCGAGKSLIALGIFSELRKREPGLKGIFAVRASLRHQWLNEIEKSTDFPANIASTYKSSTRGIMVKTKKIEKRIQELLRQSAIANRDEIIRLRSQLDEAGSAAQENFSDGFDFSKYDILVLSYETLTDDSVAKKIEELSPGFFFADEIDAAKNPSAQRSRALYSFGNIKYRFGATATPIRRDPKDLFGIFSFLDPKLFPSETKFNNTYLKFYGARVVGSKNEDILSEKIAPFIFSRTFDEIADQLPEQVVIRQYVSFTPKQQRMHAKLMEEIAELKEEESELMRVMSGETLKADARYQELENSIIARQTFAQMLADTEELLSESPSDLAAKYVSGSPSEKVEFCVNLIEKLISSGEKVVIFSKFVGIQAILAREFHRRDSLADFPVDRIIGATPEAERVEILNEYNKNKNHRILMLSDTGETGLNLSNTKYMIEFELAESAAKQTQRHGRIQRADSIHRNVFVYQLITRNSWDEIASKIIEKKQIYADTIMK